MQYLYEGQQALGEIRDGKLSHRLLTGLSLDETIARIAITTAGTKDAAQSRIYLTDALNSVIAQLADDDRASLQNSYAYSPYGQSSTVGPDSTSNPIQYTSRENDGTGLYFYRARYYDPVLKRFVSSDPIGLAGGMNVYAYVGGNPVSWIDPSGLYTEVVYWHPVGIGESQFGHVSTNINGQNFSWTPPGQWDSKYPLALDYNAIQQTFRDGRGVVLALTSTQEKVLAACMNAASGQYSISSNNCGTSVQACLKRVGVQFDKTLLPKSIFGNLSNSSSAVGNTYYPGPERTGSPFNSPSLWGF